MFLRRTYVRTDPKFWLIYNIGPIYAGHRVKHTPHWYSSDPRLHQYELLFSSEIL